MPTAAAASGLDRTRDRARPTLDSSSDRQASAATATTTIRTGNSERLVSKRMPNRLGAGMWSPAGGPMTQLRTKKKRLMAMPTASVTSATCSPRARSAATATTRPSKAPAATPKGSTRMADAWACELSWATAKAGSPMKPACASESSPLQLTRMWSPMAPMKTMAMRPSL